MKSKEQLAIRYYKKNVEGIPLTQDEVIQSFLEGFRAKEKIIKETLTTLQHLRDSINNLPLVEQILKSRDLDRINNKIEVIQSLL